MIYGNIKLLFLVNKTSVVGVAAGQFILSIFPHEKKGEDNIADAAGEPYRQEEENEYHQVGKKVQRVGHRHNDVKEGSPGAEQNVAGMGKLRGGSEIGDGDTGDRQGIYQPPPFDEADMDVAVGQFQQYFAEIGDDGIAERGDADRTNVTDDQKDPDIASPPGNAALMELVHRGGDEGAQNNVNRVEDVEDIESYSLRDMLEEQHDDDPGGGPGDGERGVIL